MYTLEYSDHAEAVIKSLIKGKKRDPQKAKKVRKALGHLSENPDHPGLNVHPWKTSPPRGCPEVPGYSLMIAYVENNTASAWRILWHYGPHDGEIPVISIVWIGPHY
ncbi:MULTISPECIES: hypothetical protein [unclassified Nocardiopsis]|uniref:hypothetical protein n=1 Tax=Nocardiopsis TaxID=2013 RepID=UPI00387B5B62